MTTSPPLQPKLSNHNTTLQPQEPTRAPFATVTTRRPSTLVLPLEHEPAQHRRNFLGRLLKRRGGNSGGKADIKAPLAEAVGTGILTLAIGMMSAASGGLGGTYMLDGFRGLKGDSERVGWRGGRVGWITPKLIHPISPITPSTGGAKAVGAAVTLYTLLLANKYSENHLNPIVTAGCVVCLVISIQHMMGTRWAGFRL